MREREAKDGELFRAGEEERADWARQMAEKAVKKEQERKANVEQLERTVARPEDWVGRGRKVKEEENEEVEGVVEGNVPVAPAPTGGSLVAFCQFGGLLDTFCSRRLLQWLCYNTCVCTWNTHLLSCALNYGLVKWRVNRCLLPIEAPIVDIAVMRLNRSDLLFCKHCLVGQWV